MQDDGHYLTVLRYIEANPLKADVVEKLQDWQWSSFVARLRDESAFKITQGPLELPSNWAKLVNCDIDKRSEKQLQNSSKRGAPFGELSWINNTAKKMNLESTIRTRGRPKKVPDTFN